MSNTIYFVDSENVISPKSLDFAIPKAEDQILFFFTENSGSLSPKVLAGMIATLTFKEVPVGDQQIDMHIATELGYCIATNGDNSEYVIISNDNHFSKIVSMWKSKGYSVSQTNTLLGDQKLSILRFGVSKATSDVDITEAPLLDEIQPQKAEYAKQKEDQKKKKEKVCYLDNIGRYLNMHPNLTTRNERKKIRKVVENFYGTSSIKKNVKKSLSNMCGNERGAKIYKVIEDAL